MQAMDHYYRSNNANVHRGAHQLSARATTAYEAVRHKIANFINAPRAEEIIYTSGTTHSLNLLAQGLSGMLANNDVILVDSAAHHANIVPWQELAKRTGAKVMPIGLTPQGRLDYTELTHLLVNHPVKLVAISHVSNVLGTVNDIAVLAALVHQHNALLAVDGAQAIAHLSVDVQALGCDFYAFSGHKMYGPTGVGVLWGHYAYLDKLQPLMTGGEMIETVSFSGSTYGALPNRLEAGTPPIAEVIGLGAAIDFIMALPATAKLQEQEVFNYLQQQLQSVPQITLYAAHPDNTGAVAFNLKGEHHQDVGILLDQQGIAIRCGHHCAQPLMNSLNITGCCRASVGIYTRRQDIDTFITALKGVIDLLS
ncbi:cysteine desulfurase [Shewanella sp. NFH-SH190041]|nr:cysteine desulfurase [Shewanella sp. NFH-SH190041]